MRSLDAVILVQQGGVVSSSPLHGLLLLLEHFILLGLSAVVGVVGDVMRNIVVRTGFINICGRTWVGGLPWSMQDRLDRQEGKYKD